MRPIPTIVQLQETIANDFKSRLNIVQDFLKRVLLALTGVLAAQFRLAYLYLSDIQNNVFPDTADIEANGGTLERQGRIFLGRNPRPATVGVFEFSVNGVSGSVMRSGLTFKSNEGSKNPGQLFILDAEYTLIGSNDIINVRSLGAGVEFDLNVSDELTITEPVIGVNRAVSVFSVVEQPRASENIEVYRQAVIDSRQLEPQGGAFTDYKLWANDAQGVRRVYPYIRESNAGTVDVYVEATIADSTDGNGTPSNSLLEDVEEVINFDPDETRPDYERGRRPAQCNLVVSPITLLEVTFVITGLNNNTPAIRQSIQDNLDTFLYNIRPYIAGADLLRNKNNVLYSARAQSIVTDTLEDGNFFTGFLMYLDGTETQLFEFGLGNIPYLGTTTYN